MNVGLITKRNRRDLLRLIRQTAGTGEEGPHKPVNQTSMSTMDETDPNRD